MIGYLEGRVVHKDLGRIIVDVGGVGYTVAVSNEAFKKAGADTVALWTHLAVRENSMELFGFADRDELALFELLLSVSGIGPKSALAILSLSTPETLRRAIAQNDLSYLTKVSGIGKKTAEKILIELKDKIGNAYGGGEESHEDVDVVEVLKSLGYSHGEARSAMQKVNPQITGTSERVKEALKILGGR